MKKQILSFILATLMVLTMFPTIAPVSAFASEMQNDFVSGTFSYASSLTGGSDATATYYYHEGANGINVDELHRIQKLKSSYFCYALWLC